MGRLVMYNDMIDPRRTWTLSGRLTDPEKKSLKAMLHGATTDNVEASILRMMDGTWGKDTPLLTQSSRGRLPNNFRRGLNRSRISNGHPHEYYKEYLNTCLHCPCTHAKVWIHLEDEGMMTKMITTSRYTTISCSRVSRESFVVGGGDEDTCPAIAEILVADIVSGRAVPTDPRIWALKYSTTWRLNPHKRIALRNNDMLVLLPHDTDRMLTSFCAHADADEYNVSDVIEAFCETNKLISTVTIWKSFCSGLMRCVDASMSSIVAAIASTRLCTTAGIAVFWDYPGDDYADVTVVTKK